ncbi:hypothetical protein JET14_13505 [Martelella lutilitoris]|uniref:Uncharacterized protein n=1 Tax=Martelella lutilitoris TaxID=2583532 RepID=A0A7T7HHK3_9HYPH|nr:hypothetical protein [Martelella lutilitoris]QQM29340.1 hypothetical protein JET14_13505 [Martelella lutilitoris]
MSRKEALRAYRMIESGQDIRQVTDFHTAAKHPHARLGTHMRRQAEQEKRAAMLEQLRREIAAEKERRDREAEVARRFSLIRKIFGKGE